MQGGIQTLGTMPTTALLTPGGCRACHFQTCKTAGTHEIPVQTQRTCRKRDNDEVQKNHGSCETRLKAVFSASEGTPPPSMETENPIRCVHASLVLQREAEISQRVLRCGALDQPEVSASDL